MPTRPVTPKYSNSVFQRAEVRTQRPSCGDLLHLADNGMFAEQRFYGGLRNGLVENRDAFFTHNGINPCFFAGRQSRLLESESSASAR